MTTYVGPNDCDVQIKIDCGKKKKEKKCKTKCITFNDCGLLRGDTGGVAPLSDTLDDYFKSFGVTVTLSGQGNVDSSLNTDTPTGVGISQDGELRRLMVFDSSNPNSAGLSLPADDNVDMDLGTPNKTVGGLGEGVGGEVGTAGENREARGNLLIVSTDNNGAQQNDSRYPGALIKFTFDSPVYFFYLDLIDSDDNNGGMTHRVKVQDINGEHLVGAATGEGQPIMNLGNNSYQRVTVEKGGVKTLTLCMNGSGGISELCFKKDKSCTKIINVCL